MQSEAYVFALRDRSALAMLPDDDDEQALPSDSADCRADLHGG